MSYQITPNIKFESFSEYVKDLDIGNSEIDVWEYINYLSHGNEFLYLLKNARESQANYKSLLRYNFDKYKRIYPEFDTFGTVTGRILISKPNIQNIKKTFRSFFVPEDDYRLLYIDFSQFEPGILAHLSKDESLLGLYNEGDIYGSLSLLVFGDLQDREIAKSLFLSFMYGMKEENILKMVNKITKSEEKMEKAKIFFRDFNRLLLWKEKSFKCAVEKGFSESINGNRRYFNKTDRFGIEKRWVVNQIIQGTASYIFKKSLLKLSKLSNKMNFLIPMHDAILLELPGNEFDKLKNDSEEIFLETFKEICPSIIPKVKFQDFASE